MNIKRHRVVSNESPFPGIALALQDRAMQCAENEGWPIPSDPPEPLLALAQAAFMQRFIVRVGEHVRDEIHFWSGRPGLRKHATPLARRVVMLRWARDIQAARQ